METDAVPRFALGERVRVLPMTQAGHTRAPQYTHGASGVITAYNGVHIFPDANAHRTSGADTVGEPLYTVEFSSVELFGAVSQPGDSVFVDLWEPYLSYA
jgi:nitrile hydratase